MKSGPSIDAAVRAGAPRLSGFSVRTGREASWQSSTEAVLSKAFERLKAKRVQLFVEKLSLNENSRVLDLGSEDGSYLASYYPWPNRITLADIHEAPMQRGVRRYGLDGYRVIPVEGSLPMEDQEFDAIWCNSAIEHVTVPRGRLGSLSDREFFELGDNHQNAFAREIARVGRHYFVQTPNMHFPIESHSFLPLVPYFGHPTRYWLSEVTKKFWLKRWTSDFLLYEETRFRRHFPDAVEVIKERAFGLPKALIAVR